MSEMFFRAGGCVGSREPLVESLAMVACAPDPNASRESVSPGRLADEAGVVCVASYHHRARACDLFSAWLPANTLCMRLPYWCIPRSSQRKGY